MKWQPATLLGASLVLAASLSASAAVSDNLAGYYQLDETNTASNVVNNGAGPDGERTATMDINQGAIVDAGYFFDGVNQDDNVFLGSSISDSLVNTDKLTFSLWVNPTHLRNPGGIGAADRHLMIGATSQLQLALRGDQRLYFNYVVTGNTNLTSPVSVTLPLNTYSHVAVTRDGADVRMYINGQQVASFTSQAGNFVLDAFDHDFDNPDPIDNPNPTATDPIRALWLGTTVVSGALTARDFDGFMDDVGIWSGKALTGQEIAAVAGLSKLVGVSLGDGSIDDVLAVFNAASGSANAGGYEWSYATGLGSSTVGATGGSAAGLDAFIVLDGSGNGVQITGLVPEPASLGLLTLGTLALAARRRSR